MFYALGFQRRTKARRLRSDQAKVLKRLVLTKLAQEKLTVRPCLKEES